MYNANQSKSSKSEKNLKQQTLAHQPKTQNLIQTGASGPLNFLEDKIKTYKRTNRRLLNELVVLDNRFNRIFTCHKRLASLCGMSVSSVFTKLHELKDDGFITIETREYDTCIYKVASILRDPIIRSRLGPWLKALLFIPVCYLSINIHPEKIKICGKTMIAKVDFCVPILRDINNNINSSSQRHWYKESPSMRETDFLKMDQKEKKFLAFERKYFEIVGQGLTSDQWETFTSFKETLLDQALLRLDRIVKQGQCLSNPFGYLCKIMQSLRQIPTQSRTSLAPECPAPKKIQALPSAPPGKIHKRVIDMTPLPENSPWNIPFPW